MYRQFNIQKFYVLPTHCNYVFCVDLRTNSDYLPVWHANCSPSPERAFSAQVPGVTWRHVLPTFVDNPPHLVTRIRHNVLNAAVCVCVSPRKREASQTSSRSCKAVEKEKLSLYLPVLQCLWHGPIQTRVLDRSDGFFSYFAVGSIRD